MQDREFERGAKKPVRVAVVRIVIICTAAVAPSSRSLSSRERKVASALDSDLVHTESVVPDTTSAQPSDGDARVVALTAEVASLRDDNTTLRDELARAQSALANLRVRYYQLLEELHC